MQLRLKIGRTSADTTAYVLAQEVDFVFTNHLFSPEREALGWKVFGRRHDAAAARPDRRAGRFAHRRARAARRQGSRLPGPEATIAYKFTYAQLLARKIEVMPVFAATWTARSCSCSPARRPPWARTRSSSRATRSARARSSGAVELAAAARPRADAFGARAGPPMRRPWRAPSPACTSTRGPRHPRSRVRSPASPAAGTSRPRTAPNTAPTATSTARRRRSCADVHPAAPAAPERPVADLAGRARVRAVHAGAGRLRRRGVALFIHYEFTIGLDNAQRRAEGLVLVMAPTILDSVVIGDYDTVQKTLQRAIRHPTSHRPSSSTRAGGRLHVARPGARAQARRRAGSPIWSRHGCTTPTRPSPPAGATTACCAERAGRDRRPAVAAGDPGGRPRLLALVGGPGRHPRAAQALARQARPPAGLRPRRRAGRRRADAARRGRAASSCAAPSRRSSARRALARERAGRAAPRARGPAAAGLARAGRRRHRGDLAPDRRADHAAAGARRPARRDLRAQPRRLRLLRRRAPHQPRQPLVHPPHRLGDRRQKLQSARSS